MKIKKIVVGQIETDCYLLISGSELSVVDPGDEPDRLISEIEKLSSCHSREGGSPDTLTPKYILLTHGHFDHVGAVKKLKEKYGFQIVLCKKEHELYRYTKGQEKLSGMILDYPGDPDILIKEGDILSFGKEKIKVLETPGHTSGSVCYLICNHLFSGDTLFPHRHGKTSFPTGSQKEMDKSLKRLFLLPNDTNVLPGHYEETILGMAKKHFI